MKNMTFNQLKQLLIESLEDDENEEIGKPEEVENDNEPESVKTRNVLNSLLGDEYNAWKQYKMMEIAAKGKSLARVVEIFKDAGKDEMEDHFDNLCKWMQSAGMKPLNDPEELDNVCGCPFKPVELEQDTFSLVNMAIAAENAAIKAYETALGMDCVKAYPDLVYLLSEFLKDEREHLLMLQDVKTQMEGFTEDETEVDDDNNGDHLDENKNKDDEPGEKIKNAYAGAATQLANNMVGNAVSKMFASESTVEENMVDDGIYDALRKGKITPQQAYEFMHADKDAQNQMIGNFASGMGYSDVTDRAGLDKAIGGYVKSKSGGFVSYDPKDFDTAIGRLASKYDPSGASLISPSDPTGMTLGSGAFSSPSF